MTDKIKDNNENREKLILCAKREFLEKGFIKASLRKIAADAGLTTGAVYFFFKDKDGLFDGVVGGALQKLMTTLDEHFSHEYESDMAGYVHEEGDHDFFAEQLVDVIYDNFDEMTLLLNKSAGTKYENLVDSIIDRMDETYIASAERFAAAVPGKRVNKLMLHWLTHVQINAFIHMMTHAPDKESALHFIKPVMDMLVKTWIEYVLEDDN